MNNGLRIALFGVGVWALPFAIGMLVFPLQESTPALFDTLSASFDTGKLKLRLIAAVHIE